MIPLSLREYIFIALLLITPLAMWYLVFIPQQQATVMMSEDIEDKSGKLETIEEARAIAMATLEEDIELLKRAMNSVHHRLPREDQMDSILQGLAILANANQLQIGEFRPVERTTPHVEKLAQAFGVQWYVFQVTGNYLNFYSFLQALENQPRITRVFKLDVEAADRRSMQGDVSANLELIAFYRKAGM